MITRPAVKLAEVRIVGALGVRLAYGLFRCLASSL
jgi:hypothetical protein